ncbi:MAG: hypothetical protein WCC58_07255, partial [Burkholderiales bacterium]
MLRVNEIKLPLDHTPDDLRCAVLARLGIDAAQLTRFTIFRRSHDARKKNAILLIYSLDVDVTDEADILKRLRGAVHVMQTPDARYKFVARSSDEKAPRPVVIGSGPCGIFAALVLAQMGFRPIVLERGKAVRERTKDTWDLWRKHILHPESNVQFGEGGAGTFSDGKLYSQIKDPKHYGRKVIDEFIKAGAPPEIAYVSKPHIGTFRLVGIVEKMRASIESLGGEFRFQQKVVDFIIKNQELREILLECGETIPANRVILAIGNSARDTFQVLRKRGVFIEAKPFSIGFRIEHPQSMIDRFRYGPNAGNPILGA